MSHQTCQVADQTLKELKALRFRKEKSNAALILKIDLATLTIVKDEFLDNTTLADVSEALPDSTPRFIVISYEMKHRDGRVSYPLVGKTYAFEIIYRSTTLRIPRRSLQLFLFQSADITGKVFDLADLEELSDDWMVQKLEASLTRP
ncbi:hypothetical protein BASA50_002100 [Batrachochytrium salamandrivorans]|uniref:ADF-H domain-containing protein n=1 Tax=Batrachochytrium salamandrivorans TaxID=1357716 RepID=A0ABQ8FQ79_9FUNG|nr:hypothetical protein BASA61_006679 [Batrachochytrium salamandrivorans]KAH6600716.1 hypothetical protein BASA50_002100 [Batrachochytrium salamandrivorans]